MWALLNNALAFPKKKASRQVEFQVQIWTGVFPKRPCRKRNHRTHLKSSQLIWRLQRMLQTKTSIWKFEWQKPAKSSPNVICLPQKNDTLKLKGKHHLKSLNLKKIVDLHARYTKNPTPPQCSTTFPTTTLKHQVWQLVFPQKTAQSQHKDTTNGCRWAIESRNNQAHNAKAKKTSAHPMAVGKRTPEKTRMRIPGPQHRHTTPNTPPSEPLKPESLTQAISRFLLFGPDPSPTPHLQISLRSAVYN